MISDDFKKNKVSTQGAAAAQAASTTVSSPGTSPDSKSSSVVPVGKSDKPDEIVGKLIASNEFRALSNKEKLEELKQHFPNVTDEAELKKLLEDINAKIATTPAEEETKQDENVSANGVDIDKMLENIINAAKKNNFEISQEDLIQIKKILGGLAQGNLKVDPKDIKKYIQPFAKLLDNLIPQETLQSEEWQKLTPIEKLNTRIDALLTVVNPNYANIDKDKKAAMRDKVVDTVASTIYPNWNKLSSGTQDVSITMIAVLLEKAETSGLSIEKILEMTPEELKKLLTDSAGEFLDKYLINNENVDFTEVYNDNGSVSLEKIVEIFVKQVNPDISPDALKQAVGETIDMLGKSFYKGQWSDPDRKEALENSLAVKLAALKEYNDQNPDTPISGQEFLTDINSQYKVIEAFEKNHGIEISPQEKLQRQLRKNNRDGSLSNNDVKEFLNEKLRNGGELTEPEKKELERIKALEKSLEGLSQEDRDKVMNAEIPDVSDTYSYHIKSRYNNDVDAWLTDFLNGRKISDIPAEQLRQILCNVGDHEMMLEIAKRFGLNNETEIYDRLGFIDTVLTIANIKDINRQSIASAHASHCKDDRSHKIGLNRVAMNAKSQNAEAAAAATKIVLSGPRGKENAVQLPERYEYFDIGKEKISDIGNIILNDKDIDIEIRGAYTDSTIKNAPDDDTRNYYANNFSKNVKDPDILEYFQRPYHVFVLRMQSLCH